MQNLSGSNIGEDASNVRHNLRVLASSELPEKDREAGRTEVLPVQWRKHLRLDVRFPLCFWLVSLGTTGVSLQAGAAQCRTWCHAFRVERKHRPHKAAFMLKQHQEQALEMQLTARGPGVLPEWT